MMGNADAHVTVHTTDRLLSAAAKGIELAKVRAGMNNLEALCHAKIAAADAFKDACKAVSDLSRVDASVISTYVTAVVRDKLDEQRNKAEQLDLLFTELET